jgi:hypothetical protein
MNQALENKDGESVATLLAFNAAMLEQHKLLRCFQFFSDGTLDDPAKREVFLSCLQALARHFQVVIFMRQAHCADERFGSLFMRHLREEIGHDEVLRQDRGRSDDIWDPVIEAVGAWFASRMSMLDNLEKMAVVHLVLESSGAHMGLLSRKTMPRYGSAKYFQLHDEVDDSHVAIAIQPLQGQSPETLARLRVVVDQAWQMMNTWGDRVASIVLGTVSPLR